MSGEQILYNRPAFPARLDMSHPLTKGLVGCWVMNENEGISVFDSSPYGKHGLVVGATGTHRGRLFANGNNIQVSTPSSAHLNFTSSDFTFVAWIKPDNLTGNKEILSRGAYLTDGYYIRLLSASLDFETQQVGVRTTLGGGVCTTDWQQVAFVKSGSDGFIYRNGASVATGTLDNPVSATRVFEIGSFSGNYFIGLYGGLFAYNRALIAQEVKNLYLNPYDMFLK